MGIYYGEDKSSFTSTLDIKPVTFFNSDLNSDISMSDFLRVCNVLNVKNKDTIAAIIIQRWWKNIKYKKFKKDTDAAITIQKWWEKVNKKTNTKNKETFSIWNLLWFL